MHFINRFSPKMQSPSSRLEQAKIYLLDASKHVGRTWLYLGHCCIIWSISWVEVREQLPILPKQNRYVDKIEVCTSWLIESVLTVIFVLKKLLSLLISFDFKNLMEIFLTVFLHIHNLVVSQFHELFDLLKNPLVVSSTGCSI